MDVRWTRKRWGLWWAIAGNEDDVVLNLGVAAFKENAILYATKQGIIRMARSFNQEECRVGETDLVLYPTGYGPVNVDKVSIEAALYQARRPKSGRHTTSRRNLPKPPEGWDAQDAIARREGYASWSEWASVRLSELARQSS